MPRLTREKAAKLAAKYLAMAQATERVEPTPAPVPLEVQVYRANKRAHQPMRDAIEAVLNETRVQMESCTRGNRLGRRFGVEFFRRGLL